MKKILGIGNALVDILIRIGDEKILEKMNLPKGSMQLVNKLRSDEILEALLNSPRSIAAGGSAANTVHGLAMLGAKAGFIGTIGKDQLGDSFEQDMHAAGVEPYLIRSDSETGRAITLITTDSERTFATFLGAAVELSAPNIAELASPIFPMYDYLHVEGYLIQDHDLVRTTMELAKHHGLMVSLDLASYNVVEGHLDFLQEILKKYVDILFANEEEAKSFTGFEPEEALHYISQFCEIAIVKTGGKGSLIKSREVRSQIGVIPANPIDTTGAGDLYAAGFLYGHALGWPLVKCGEMGALLAGNIIEEIGAKMPAARWEKVKSFENSN
ncbi:MAG: adenosine kinase [bacterium]